MQEEDIKKLNEWVDDEERSFHTERDEKDEYYISQRDVDSFCCFLTEMNPDLIGIQCTVGTGGIWFTKSDLLKARYI